MTRPSVSQFSLSFLLVYAAATLTACGDDGPAIADPTKAGKEFAIQGEYVGLAADDNWGAQVIALGDGKFRCVGYPGGLPGDGFQADKGTKVSDGALEGDVAKLTGEDYRLEIGGDRLKVTSLSGDVVGTLLKVNRESPTLGQKPPQGAIVLFDGSNADAFENGKMTPEKLLEADCSSKEKFGSHALHIEFRTPFKPLARGQARGNSGVYIQSRYELQVLDSFGLSGENNECGGIYSIAKPLVNMCYPPLAWQTYDIDFTAAKYDSDGKKASNPRVTIRHNGVLIHKDLELTKGTPGRHAEGSSDDALYLQGHGNPVVFRNVWVVKK